MFAGYTHSLYAKNVFLTSCHRTKQAILLLGDCIPVALAVIVYLGFFGKVFPKSNKAIGLLVGGIGVSALLLMIDLAVVCSCRRRTTILKSHSAHSKLNQRADTQRHDRILSDQNPPKAKKVQGSLPKGKNPFDEENKHKPLVGSANTNSSRPNASSEISNFGSNQTVTSPSRVDTNPVGVDQNEKPTTSTNPFDDNRGSTNPFDPLPSSPYTNQSVLGSSRSLQRSSTLTLGQGGATPSTSTNPFDDVSTNPFDFPISELYFPLTVDYQGSSAATQVSQHRTDSHVGEEMTKKNESIVPCAPGGPAFTLLQAQPDAFTTPKKKTSPANPSGPSQTEIPRSE